jgi:hypothetical protein
MLRRAMGRLRIDDDIVRHLSTFQRLGEAFEVEMPSELLPVGARTVFRALRTRAVPQIGVDWVWPYWLERQIDPTSPAFVPRGHLPFLTNVTGRNWTAIGNVSSPWRGVVDPRGLVTPWYDGWSLDWWIGADDRWRFPSREPSIRQRLFEGGPVVETAMAVPGGDAIHRVYAVRDGERELAVVEIENASPLPFAVALAVRPANTEGLAVVERIELHDTTVTVDGRPALLLPSRPRRTVGSTFHGGDSASVVVAGEAGEDFPARLRCEAGMAQAAFLFPLAHRQTMRVALPLVPRRRSRRRGVARRRAAATVELPERVPTAADAARAWQRQTDRGMRVVLPAGQLADAVEANRRYLLLFHDGDDVTPGPSTYHRFWFRDAAFILAALDRWGFHAEAAQVLATFPDRQRVDGFFFSQRQEWDSNGAALWALAEHWRLTRDTALVEGMEQMIGRGVHWIERKRRSKQRRRLPAMEGLLPPGISAEHLGPFDFYYWDDFWGVAGMHSAAVLLSALDEEDGAADAERLAAGFWADVGHSLDLVAAHRGDRVIPAGPGRHLDPAIIGSLVACWPLELLGAHDEAITATAGTIRDRFCLDRAFYQGISHTGLGTYLTLQLAFVELEAGDPRCLERLAWLLEAATPTWTWPEAIHPRLPGGCMGDGHHGWAASDFLSFVRNLLVRDRPDGLELVTLLPPEWRGQPIEVHDAPTHWGRLSFAVRWHGERPALLWELDPHPGIGPVRISSPGLDGSWSSGDLAGEALLAAPATADR